MPSFVGRARFDLDADLGFTALTELLESTEHHVVDGGGIELERRRRVEQRSLLAGLAGGLYAFHEGFVGPNMPGVVFSTQIVLYALFGGVGTLIGAVIGVFAIEIVSFWLADNYQQVWPIILGLLLLLVILFRPTGLIGLLVSERERVGTFGRLPRTLPRAAQEGQDEGQHGAP